MIVSVMTCHSAQEKDFKAKQKRMAAPPQQRHGRDHEDSVDPVSPRINFKYDSRLGLFGFDIEAERQSKRENYALMRQAREQEQGAVLARARVRAQVVHGAGLMDAQTFLPGGFANLQPSRIENPKKVKVKVKDRDRDRDRAKPHRHGGQPIRNKMRSKSDFKPEPPMEEHQVRSISSENDTHIKKITHTGITNKHVHKAHIEDEILAKYQHNSLDAMQCSPIETNSERKKKKKVVQRNPKIVTEVGGGDDFYCDDNNYDIDHETVGEHDNKILGAEKKGQGKKVKISPLKLSGIKKQRDKAYPPSYTENTSHPSPRHDQPTTPTTGDIKNSFQRNKPRDGGDRDSDRAKTKSHLAKAHPNQPSVGASSSPRRHKKSSASSSSSSTSPRRKKSQGSPGKQKTSTKFDVDILDSVSIDDPSSDSKPKPKPKPPPTNSPRRVSKKEKKSIADELFEEFEAFNVHLSPPSEAKKIGHQDHSHQNKDKDKDKEKEKNVPKASPKARSPRKSMPKHKKNKKEEESTGEGSEKGAQSPRSSLAAKKAKKKTFTSPASRSPPKKNSQKTSLSPAVVSKKKVEKEEGEEEEDYEDDTELYNEDDFAEEEGDGGVKEDEEDDVLFDFSPQKHKSQESKRSQKAKDDLEEVARIQAEEEEEARVASLKKEQKQKETERLALEKAEEEANNRKKLEEERRVAIAKEEKRKARAVARAKEDEAERVAQKKKRDELAAEAKRVVAKEQELAALKIRKEEQKKREADEEHEKKRVAIAEAKRLAEEESTRLAAAAAKEEDEENERVRQLAMTSCKEEKLEKASHVEVEDLEESQADAVASPKKKKLDDEEEVVAEKDEYDDYVFEEEEEEEEEDIGEPDQEQEQEQKQEEGQEDLFSLTPVVDPSPSITSTLATSSSPTPKTKHTPEVQADMVVDTSTANEYVSASEEKSSTPARDQNQVPGVHDNHAEDTKNKNDSDDDYSDEDVLFDFNKSSSPKKSPHVNKNVNVNMRAKDEVTEKEKEEVAPPEEEGIDEYGSDYDDEDFD